jgi:hypothetical protein
LDSSKQLSYPANKHIAKDHFTKAKAQLSFLKINPDVTLSWLRKNSRFPSSSFLAETGFSQAILRMQLEIVLKLIWG